MKKVNIDTWIQLLGMLGVLAGLLFVGLEMRQSQTIAVAGQTQARNQAQLDFQLAVLTAEERLSRRILGMGALPMLDPTMLTQEENEARRHIVNWRITSLQNAFQQYQLGLIPEDVWEQVRDRIQGNWGSCYIRASFAGVIPSFRKFLLTLPEDCIPESIE